MRIRVIVLLSFCLNALAFGQSSPKITGKLSSETGAVPFATVFVKNTADSSVVKVALSDTSGNFKFIGVTEGHYFVYATMVGLAPYTSETFELSFSDVDLGKIQMNPNTELATVNVVAARPIIEVQPDKTVFNVQGTLNATGANGFDLLRKAPGVIIDNNNNIVLEGKSGVQVYVDNKPTILAGEDLVNYLKSMQAADIDKIEIITQPSSKYEAAGNAGIINVVLKRDKNLGTNGTITAGYGYGIYHNHHANGSFSLNHRKKKVNFYTSYSNSIGTNWSFFYLDRTQFGSTYESRSDNNDYQGSHNGKAGVDWYINPKHTIGFLASGNYFDSESNGANITEIGPTGFTDPTQILTANNTGVGLNYRAAGNINYRFADTLGHEFTADVDYGIYSREANNYQPNSYMDVATQQVLYENNYRMITPTDISIATAKIDYNQNLWGGKLSLGAKVSFVTTDNTLNFYDVVDQVDNYNADRSNQFTYTENISAGYVNYARVISQKLNFQLGLRAEQTNSVGDLVSTQVTAEDHVERHYLNFFPSGGLTWSPNANHTWALTFSRRIQRPNYQSLNPFTWQVNELSFMKGNPFLQPQYGNNVKVSHTFKYRFSTSLSYSYVEDFFAQINDTLGQTKSYLISKNVADEQTITLGVSLPFSVTKWWSVFISVNAFHTSYIGTDDKFQAVDRFTASAYGQNTFLLPKGFKFEISGWYSSPSIWGGTYLTGSMGALDLALEKKFLEDRLSLRVSCSDVLFTSYWQAHMSYGELSVSGSGGWESRIARIQLSYNFGNKDVKKVRDRKTGLEDEDKRTGGS
ncbi:MAG: TonB-dependent receptor [Bacteroidetes bacterium]|nr:TonB-dependent receptor [Bacteroidota bacterium]